MNEAAYPVPRPLRVHRPRPPFPGCAFFAFWSIHPSDASEGSRYILFTAGCLLAQSCREGNTDATVFAMSPLMAHLMCLWRIPAHREAVLIYSLLAYFHFLSNSAAMSPLSPLWPHSGRADLMSPLSPFCPLSSRGRSEHQDLGCLFATQCFLSSGR